MRDAQGSIGLIGGERDRYTQCIVRIVDIETTRSGIDVRYVEVFRIAEQVRRARMAWLVKMLKSVEPPINTKKFVAVSAYNQAVSVTKIREYLDLLVDMEVLEEDGEVLKWVG